MDLEELFTFTFHENSPIRAKPERENGPRVDSIWLKKMKTKESLNNRFDAIKELVKESVGDTLDDDLIDDEEIDFEDQQEDVDEPMDETPTSRDDRHRNLVMNLAKKLKKRSICNRIGMIYQPGRNRFNAGRNRLNAATNKQKTNRLWSQKFGHLLAAKKLLYLPLLYRKYKSGPKKSKEELDLEIELYMAQCKNSNNGFKAMHLNGFDEGLSGSHILKTNRLFSGFGGPKWKKKLNSESLDINKEDLDNDLDAYMRKAINNNNNNDGIKKEELDQDLDTYMREAKSGNELILMKDLDEDIDTYMREAKGKK